MTRRLDRLDQNIAFIVDYMKASAPPSQKEKEPKKEDEPVELKRQSPSVVPPEVRPEVSSMPLTRAAFATPDQPRMDVPSLPQNLSIPDETVDYAPDTVASIHIDHTTGAHRLLKWRAIAELLAGLRINENYVMEEEEKKGLLRVYGKSQGRDDYDGARSNNPSSPASTASGEELNRSFGYSSEEDWGFDLGPPNIVDGKYFNNEKDHPGGLLPNGQLKLDRGTMAELQDSYERNLHILHPFLDKVRLRRMVDKIYRDYHPNEAQDPRASANVSPYTPHARTLKRKHSSSDAHAEASINMAPGGVLQEPKLARRISTVIVLLVMALGKICLHTKPLPGFAPSKDPLISIPSTSPQSHALSPSTTVSSPMSAGDLRGFKAQIRASGPDFSISRMFRRGDKNIDVIPGLAYYARAVEILGALQGNDLPFVQA